MTPAQREAIKKHGEQLNTIFHTGIKPVELCERLHRIEVQAHRNAEDYCNGVLNIKIYEKRQAALEKRLDAILHYKFHRIPVFFNGDPRGYALKIEDEYMRVKNVILHRDMGGYGIIAPEIEKDEKQ